VLIQSAPLGFSITSALKTAAKDTYQVASDPRAQALVAAAGQAYAPDTTSQVMQVTHRVQGDIRRARQFWYGGHPVMVQPGQMPPPGATEEPPPPEGLPVQDSHMLVYAGIGAGLLLLLLIMKR